MHHIPYYKSGSKFNSTSNEVILMATPVIPPEDSKAETMDYGNCLLVNYS